MSTNQGEPPTPSAIDREWETNIVSFPGFADLSTPKGNHQSSKFISLGREWCVWLFPRGDDATPDESQVSMYLALTSPGKSLKVEYGFAVPDITRRPAIRDFSPAEPIFGSRTFSTRDKILARLVDGALLVTVKMRHADASHPFFIPDNPAMCKVVQSMFMDDEFADITFEIGGGLDDMSPTLFHAHRNVLKKAAPRLAELVISTAETPSRIRIGDMSPDTFKALLLYIYGCKIPHFGKDIARTKEIIEVADKYGVTNLKLEAEAHYVSSIKFSLGNMVENLLFAEARNCALLKEKVMRFMVINAVEIVERETLKDFPDGLNDALAALAINEKEKKCELSYGGNEPMSSLPICELRRRAQEKGVDVDGTREMLLSALDQD